MFKDYSKEIRRLMSHQPLILTSVMVLIVDSEGRLLLQKRAGTGAWHVPGGFLELGEALEDAARREALEETGLSLGALTLVGAYSGPDFHSGLSPMAMKSTTSPSPIWHGTSAVPRWPMAKRGLRSSSCHFLPFPNR